MKAWVIRLKYLFINASERPAELNRRVEIEQYLLDCAHGKHPLPDTEVCRKLALRLGTPKTHWSDVLKEPLP